MAIACSAAGHGSGAVSTGFHGLDGSFCLVICAATLLAVTFAALLSVVLQDMHCGLGVSWDHILFGSYVQLLWGCQQVIMHT